MGNVLLLYVIFPPFFLTLMQYLIQTNFTRDRVLSEFRVVEIQCKEAHLAMPFLLLYSEVDQNITQKRLEVCMCPSVCLPGLSFSSQEATRTQSGGLHTNVLINHNHFPAVPLLNSIVGLSFHCLKISQKFIIIYKYIKTFIIKFIIIHDTLGDT